MYTFPTYTKRKNPPDDKFLPFETYSQSLYSMWSLTFTLFSDRKARFLRCSPNVSSHLLSPFYFFDEGTKDIMTNFLFLYDAREEMTSAGFNHPTLLSPSIGSLHRLPLSYQCIHTSPSYPGSPLYLHNPLRLLLFGCFPLSDSVRVYTSGS